VRDDGVYTSARDLEIVSMLAPVSRLVVDFFRHSLRVRAALGTSSPKKEI
jgi:hypothetical protein